ncbi:hypothetical protein MKHDV_01844 [Halodesulfovibrio sp. MK-HDV]|nr:hypothetical protein MKHDV_01844 [Halodesulfovibrio sp. MK-HDV]
MNNKEGLLTDVGSPFRKAWEKYECLVEQFVGSKTKRV